MLDLKFIRENLDAVKRGIANKQVKIDFDRIMTLDGERRSSLEAVETLKRDRNNLSQEVGRLKKAGEDAGDIMERVRNIGEEIKEIEEKLRVVQEELDDLLDRIPNLPHASTPVGKDASENVEVHRWGNPVTFDFEPLDHLAIGEKLGLFDFTRGSKVTGRGFPVYTGKG
ncbi:MAG TPA: serine--tRNA ligase, partial [Calditrichia bacterium]|nr:serine--tRNA ligase [Calditrichia bacterium]